MSKRANGRPVPLRRPAGASRAWNNGAADPAAREVIYVRLTSANFERLHPSTVNLLRNHGDGRLTLRALRLYASLKAEDVGRPGTFILAALDSAGRVIAVTAAVRWGYELSLSAVHRNHRGRGLAGAMLRLVVRALGRYYAEVASDNLPSLRAFFACGLMAYDVFTRPNGKIVLRLRTIEPGPPDAPGTKEADTGGD